MATARISVLVSNAYDDGTEVFTTDTATVPPPPADEDGREEWWQEHVFPLTGSGRFVDGNALYTVWITASDAPALVGLTHEF